MVNFVIYSNIEGIIITTPELENKMLKKYNIDPSADNFDEMFSRTEHDEPAIQVASSAHLYIDV